MIYRWIVFDSKFAVDDPTFLCERCLRNTHYGEDHVEEEDHDEKDKEKIALSELSNQSEDTREGSSQDLNRKTLNNLKKLCNFKAYHFSQI